MWGTEGRTDGSTDGRTDGRLEIPPCVVQVGYIGAAAQKGKKRRWGHEREGPEKERRERKREELDSSGRIRRG